MPSIFAIVVTYNRLGLLKTCIEALRGQTKAPTRILIVDNASTDGTREWLAELQQGQSTIIETLTLASNIGGAGGFASGMRSAFADGADWVWMMDDDALPAPDALEALVEYLPTKPCILGSVAVDELGNFSWPLAGGPGELYASPKQIADVAPAMALPFLGIAIPRGIVEKIGYPDAEYFIAGDDTEYCQRATCNGFDILAVGRSQITHPASSYYRFGMGRFAPVCFRIAPWKRYYDVRNRILTSRQHGGHHVVWTRTLPATLLRLLATLINEPERTAQLIAYIGGIADGVRGIKGIRHKRWGLGPLSS